MQFHNELEFLPGWFDQVKKYADEIICGNHNANDGSREYVEDLQKKSDIPITLLDFPADIIHDNGFCYMKNALAEKATGDWIVSLDADEEMDMNKETLGVFLQGRHICLSTLTMHISAEQRQADWTLDNREQIKQEAPWIMQKHWRIFRNGLGIKWKGLIHEELRHPSGMHVSLNCRATNIKMWHYGALANPLKRDFKDGLYAELLLRVVENPELRTGTNKWWYTTYFEEHKDELYKQREEYRQRRNDAV